MSKHVRTSAATAGAKLQATLALAHPRGLPVLLHPDGTVHTCNPGADHYRIGTFDKQSDNLSLTIAEELTAAVTQWRAEQKPRARTERVTAYRAFLKKSKAALSKQAGATTPAPAEDHTD
jgi:hypothetical protein